MSRIITIASAKGGVGKSTIALNLATALTQLGHDSIAIDGNLSSPTLSIHLGIPNTETNIHGHLCGEYTLDKTIYRHPASGVKIIPGSISLSKALQTPPNALTSISAKLRSYFPYSIVDSAAGIRDETLAAINLGDETIIIATPDLPGIIAARKTIEIAKKLGKPTSVILNHPTIVNEIQTQDVTALLRTPLLGVIPHDTLIPHSQTIKQPIVQTHPESPAGQSILNIARKIITT